MNTKFRRQTRTTYFFYKRLFDIVFSLCFISILSPVYLITIILIKLNSEGPAFYTGVRLGRNQKHIKIYKFRTMYVDAEERLKVLLNSNPSLRKEWSVFQKIENDPRITPIGTFLRKTSLDEFPQFFNVLKGDLSVVGPRPHFIEELNDKKNSPLKKHAEAILSVKPGITGIWQISGRSNLSYQNRVELDTLYSKKSSMLLDLQIILKTIPIVLFSRGAI